MYADRKHVRDIVNRIRTNEITHEKGVFLASKNKKQLATFYHEILDQAIDEMYQDAMAEAENLTGSECGKV